MNTNTTCIPPSRHFRRLLLRGLLLLLMLFATALYFLDSVLVAIDGGFFRKEVYSISSPDRRDMIVISKRAKFPASEFIDPRTIAIIELRNVATGKMLDFVNIELEEGSDLREPRVKWLPSTIHVTKIDSRHERTFILSRAKIPRSLL